MLGFHSSVHFTKKEAELVIRVLEEHHQQNSFYYKHYANHRVRTRLISLIERIQNMLKDGDFT